VSAVRRGWLLLALLLSLGVNLGLIAGAVARRRAIDRWEAVRTGEWRPPEGVGRRLADRLDLEAGERERFVAVQRRLVESTITGRRRIAELRFELRGELLAERPDRARIDALLDELAGAEASLDRAFAESVLESRAILGERRAEAYLRILERFAPGRGGPPPHGRRDWGGPGDRFGPRR
jgi:hypothetical protein